MRTRRTFLTLAALLTAACLTKTARAQALPKPFVIYDDELKNGWQNRSWATVTLSAYTGGPKPIKVEGDPWGALMLYHAPFSTVGMSKLVFSISGGKEGGQTLKVKVMSEGKAFLSDVVIQPKAKTWGVVEVPLKDLGAAGQTIDAISWQGQANAFSAFYITRIQLE